MTKATGSPEIQPFSLAHELLGCRLARTYGLRPAQVEVVSLSPGFLDATRSDLAEAGLRWADGFAVGSAFIPDLLPFPVPVQLADDELAEAAAIYVFDLLIQNPDRSVANPNCGRAGRWIVPYDFETAFSFRFAVPKLDPWRVGQLPFCRKHLFYGALRQATIDWPSVFSRLRAVPITRVADVCSTIPPAWVEVGQEVLSHFTVVHEHCLQFEQEVAISLGNAS